MRHLLPFALSMSLVGCIVYDEELLWDDGTPVENPDREPGDRPSDTPDDDEPVDDGFSLSPDGALAGDALIVFVEADEDLGDVREVAFFGPSQIDVTATAFSGATTLVVSIDIPGNAAGGLNDVVIEHDDGSVTFLEDAFLVE